MQPKTRETLQHQLAQLEATAKECDEHIARLIEEKAMVLRWAAQIRDALAGLPGGDDTRIIRVMDVDTTGRPEAVKRGAARATRKHPALRELYEQGHTVTSLARELRESRTRVSAWFGEGSTNRPIPRRHAEHLLKRYKIPLSAWDRIAD